MDMYDKEMERLQKEYVELYNEYQRTRQEFHEALQKIIRKQNNGHSSAIISNDIRQKLNNLFWKEN